MKLLRVFTLSQLMRAAR